MSPTVPDTKEKLAISATKLLIKKSIHDISVGDISKNAGLSNRTFYNYFKDKNELISYNYYLTTEKFWFTDGKKNSLEQFFKYCERYLKDSHMLRAFGHALDYHGQNDLRSEIENKGVQDLIRLLKWNRFPDEITDELQQTLHFFMCGITRLCELHYLNSHPVHSERLFSFWINCVPAYIAEYLIKNPN